MSTTLHAHPPQRADPPQPPDREAPRLHSRRPTTLDKLALRVGLLLITYGRRRYALSREDLSLVSERESARHAREREWERSRLLLLPPR